MTVLARAAEAALELQPEALQEQQVQPQGPAPPKCDPECQRAKKAEKLRIDNERDAKEVAVPPPGNPSCSNGKPSLCPSKPGGPETKVGDYVDTTGGNIDQAEQLQIDAENDLGSVIGSISTAGAYHSIAFYDNPVHPHPDRYFEMAGCSGGPNCVMPEGYAETFGPYGWKPGEEAFGDFIMTAWIPMPPLLKLAPVLKGGQGDLGS